MKQLLTITFLALALTLNAQNAIEWDGTYQIQLSDYQSTTTQIGGTNIYSLYSAVGTSFSFAMSNAEFMFTKNFNSKVDCSFNRSASSLVAPDSATAQHLIAFARYEFDLAELYARKLRKKLYDEKGAFSSSNFFRPVYDQIQAEHTERHTIAAKTTNIENDQDKLKELHHEVLREIEALADFCKTCKPPKKKK